MFGIEWSPTYITSQVFICIGYALLAATYLINNRARQLGTTITSNTAMGIGFAILGGYVGLAMCVIAIARDTVSEIIYMKRPAADRMKTMRSDYFWLALWATLMTVVTLATQNGFMTMFAYFASMTFMISIWQKNVFVYRLLGILVGIFWITYNVVVKSFFGVTLEFILLLFVIAGTIKYIQRNKKSKLKGTL